MSKSESVLLRALPCQYVEHMARCAGLWREDGLLLYPAEALVERNQTFEVQDYLPGFLLIGDDSGGRGFLIRFDEDLGKEIFMSGLGCLMEDYFTVVAGSLAAWSDADYPVPE
ncbi:MAG: hypothetical protein ACT4NV_11160 [Rhodoferax sp.]